MSESRLHFVSVLSEQPEWRGLRSGLMKPVLAFFDVMCMSQSTMCFVVYVSKQLEWRGLRSGLTKPVLAFFDVQAQ